MFTCQIHGRVYNNNRRCPHCFRERINSYQNYLDNNHINNSINNFRTSDYDLTNPTFLRRSSRHYVNRNSVINRYRSRTRYNTILNRENRNREIPIRYHNIIYNNRLFYSQSVNNRTNLLNRHSYLSRRISPMRINYNSHSLVNNTSDEFINTFNRDNMPINNLILQKTASFFNKNQSLNNKICSICQCNFSLNEKLRLLPCMHFYHCKCISKWLRNSNKCPICQHPI